MMRAVAIAALAALLVGCETAPRVPEEVLVPVPVPCKVDKPRPPVWATASLKPDADIFDQVKALLAERRQRVAYERQLEAAIAACQ